MSDRKDRADSKEEEGTLHPEKLSQGTGNLKEPAVVSCVTAKCAELYEAMMDDVCAVGKVPPKPKHLGVNRGSKNREPSHLFDFCDQMKREMDESFRSNLNSFVKKSCKTKYRFYMLVTSDDALFDETKVRQSFQRTNNAVWIYCIWPAFLKPFLKSVKLIPSRRGACPKFLCFLMVMGGCGGG